MSEEAQVPEVSKEKFFEVKDELKEAFQRKEDRQSFSLLSMFGDKGDGQETKGEFFGLNCLKKNTVEPPIELRPPQKETTF